MKSFVTISLLWIIAIPTAIGQIQVDPISAFGGPVPVPYNSRYTSWDSDPIPTSDITVNSLDTFYELRGINGRRQSNGAFVDTGTFYILNFQIPISSYAFHIEFTAEVNYPGGSEHFLLEGQTRDDLYPSSQPLLWESKASQPTTFGMTIYRDSSDNNQSGWGQSWGQDWGLNDMQNPDGTFTLVLLGSSIAQISRLGYVRSTLYDVSASYTPIPEPISIGFLIMGCCVSVIFCKRNCGNQPR